jgi:hypothetical protein
MDGVRKEEERLECKNVPPIRTELGENDGFCVALDGARAPCHSANAKNRLRLINYLQTSFCISLIEIDGVIELLQNLRVIDEEGIRQWVFLGIRRGLRHQLISKSLL